MSNQQGNNLTSAEAELLAADRELGRQAFAVVVAPRFPEYAELVYEGGDELEPHLIYRGDNSFLVVDTAIIDYEGKQDSRMQRELPDGRWVERGTVEYLLAGLQDASKRMVNGTSLLADVISAVSEKRLRYILVEVKIGGAIGEREVKSLRLAEFEL